MRRTAILSVSMAVMAAAQQDTPTPTFRSGTRLVEVGVVARSNGAPAAGLTKDDFTVLDNGKPQKIAVFSMQSGAVMPGAVGGVAPLPAGVVSNRLERSGPRGLHQFCCWIREILRRPIRRMRFKASQNSSTRAAYRTEPPSTRSGKTDRSGLPRTSPAIPAC